VVADARRFRQIRQRGIHPRGGARDGGNVHDCARRGESKAMTAALRCIYVITSVLLFGLPVAAAGADGPTPTSTRRIAQDADWTYGLSLYPEYSEGTYGTRHTTQIVYAPLISEWSPTDRLDLRLTIPFLWERGREILALIGGGTARDAQRVRVS